MIYLFEDRPTRINQYLGRDTLPDGVTLAKFEFNGSSNEVATYISNNFSDIEVILFHKSYSFDDNTELAKNENNTRYLDAISDYCSLTKIPFVIFSGGIETINYYIKNGTLFGSVNSQILYQNLDAFLLKKDIRVLCLGRNFAKNEFMNFLRELHINFSSKDPSTLLLETDKRFIHELSEKYMASSQELDKIFTEFYQWMNENSELLTFSMVSSKLPNLFQRIIPRR